MQQILSPSAPYASRIPALLGLACAALLALVAAASIYAQVSGDRGIAPVASSTDIEVRDIKVNVKGDNPQDARENGWREAQRLAWKQIDGPDIPDSRLQSLVSAVLVQEESVGPRRYIATLGVIFDRQRAGPLLGGGGARARSAPMLTLPVTISGGSQVMFEYRNAWQRAWAEYQFGASAIDYVRPTGAGGESLLLTYGQTSRRSRVWWNTILDQFNAADVLVPVVQLQRQWPGGPIEGRFTARYGPDNRRLGDFTLRAASEERLPAMLSQAVARLDEIYTKALADGQLRPDPTLTLDTIEISPEIRALLEQARAAEARAISAAAGEGIGATGSPTGPDPVVPDANQQPAMAVFSVQVATPDAASFESALGAIRAIPGASSVVVSSTAIGGTSVMRVNYNASLSALAGALRSRGWQVTEGNNALAISR